MWCAYLVVPTTRGAQSYPASVARVMLQGADAHLLQVYGGLWRVMRVMRDIRVIRVVRGGTKVF